MAYVSSFAQRGLAASLACGLLFSAAPALVESPAALAQTTRTGTTTPSSTAATSTSTSSSTSRSTSEKTTSTKTSTTTSSEETSEPSAPASARAEVLQPQVLTKWGREVQDRIDAVTEELNQGRSRIGIGILDRETGEFLCNSECESSFALASLSKVFVADVVAYTNYDRPTSGTITAGSGDMPRTGNRDAMARDAMIRYSDNEATNLLWAGYGGTEIIDNVKERYRLSDATMASPDWGATLSSPADLVAYFDRMLDREGDLSEVETEYLRQLLYSLPRYSYGDADQNIGLRAALPKERVANKSGWVDPQIRTTAGFMGDNDRYAIAVLGSYISAEELTGAIKDVFPKGEISSYDDAPTDAPAQVAPAEADSSNSLAIISALITAVVAFAVGYAVRGVRD